MGNIKFGISGCGAIGKLHAKMIDACPTATLTSACDISSLGESLGREYEIPFYNDLNELLEKHTDTDVISICSPNYLHAEQAIACLKAGHHVLIEKPMGLTSEECEEVIKVSLNTSRKVFCVMQNRYAPAAQLLKKIVEENRLGRIQMISTICFWNRDERYYKPDGKDHPWRGSATKDGGVLFTQFAHFIDLLYWLFGDLQIQNFQSKQFISSDLIEFDDSGSFTYQATEDKALGTFQFSTASWDKNFDNQVMIQGSRGSIKISGQYLEKLDYIHLENMEGLDLNISGKKQSGHAKVIDNVIDVIHHGGDVATNAMDGLKVVEIIERIYRSNTQR